MHRDDLRDANVGFKAVGGGVTGVGYYVDVVGARGRISHGRRGGAGWRRDFDALLDVRVADVHVVVGARRGRGTILHIAARATAVAAMVHLVIAGINRHGGKRDPPSSMPSQVCSLSGGARKAGQDGQEGDNVWNCKRDREERDS